MHNDIRLAFNPDVPQSFTVEVWALSGGDHAHGESEEISARVETA